MNYLIPDVLMVQRDSHSLGALVPFPETCPEAYVTILGEGGSPKLPPIPLTSMLCRYASGTVRHRHDSFNET